MISTPDILSRIAERIARRYRNRDEDDNLQGLNTEDVIRVLAVSELAPVGKVLEAAQRYAERFPASESGSHRATGDAMTNPEPTERDWADQAADKLFGLMLHSPAAIGRQLFAEGLRTARREGEQEAEQRGYEQGIEDACTSMCKLCAAGQGTVQRCRSHYHHYAPSPAADAGEGDMCIVGDCAATPIRRALAAKGESDGE